jgi:hypothetical protein
MTGQDRSPQDGRADKAQPESLAEFDKAARSGGRKPDDVGLTATPETGPRPDDPADKDRTATEVLRAGVAKDPQAATKAAQSRRDPRIDK